MSVWSRLLRASQKDDPEAMTDEHGEPGPVLDADGRPLPLLKDGRPVLDRKGNPRPLLKVRVVTRRDPVDGSAEEWVWVDPRDAWQYRENLWHDDWRR